VDFLDFGTQGVEQAAAGLNHEDELAGVFDLALPVVNAADSRQDVNAGGQPALNQLTGHACGRFFGVAGTQHYDLVGHFLADSAGHFAIFLRIASAFFASGVTPKYFV
jgi:hypothetical protein